MEGTSYEAAGARGVLGRRECKSAEKRAKIAKPPVPNDTADRCVDQPLDKVAWMHAATSPVFVSVSVSCANDSKSGILYAMLGTLDATLREDGSWMEVEPVKLYVGRGPVNS